MGWHFRYWAFVSIPQVQLSLPKQDIFINRSWPENRLLSSYTGTRLYLPQFIPSNDVFPTTSTLVQPLSRSSSQIPILHPPPSLNIIPLFPHSTIPLLRTVLQTSPPISIPSQPTALNPPSSSSYPNKILPSISMPFILTPSQYLPFPPRYPPTILPAILHILSCRSG